MFLIQKRKSNNTYLKNLSEKNLLENYNFRMHLNCVYDFLSLLIPGLDWHLPRHCWLNEWLQWMTAWWEWWVGIGDHSVCFTCTLLFYRIDPYMKAKFYFFWKPVQWKPRTGLILSRPSAEPLERVSCITVEWVLLLCSFTNMLTWLY